MRVPTALLLMLCATAAQARPAAFVAVHALGMAALPQVPAPPASPSPAPPDARARYLPLIAREAAGRGLPVAVADAVARIESGYDPGAVGSVGEVGLMQVRPATAAMLGFRGTAAELAAPEVNVRYGVRYLAEAWRRADGDLCRALMKYRAGHGSEAMSPLSQLYCARARAILADPEAPPGPAGGRWTATAGLHADDAEAGPRRARTAGRRSGEAARSGRGHGHGPDETAPTPARPFWEVHRERVARLNALVLERWRARGWTPDRMAAASSLR